MSENSEGSSFPYIVRLKPVRLIGNVFKLPNYFLWYHKALCYLQSMILQEILLLLIQLNSKHIIKDRIDLVKLKIISIVSFVVSAQATAHVGLS